MPVWAAGRPSAGDSLPLPRGHDILKDKIILFQELFEGASLSTNGSQRQPLLRTESSSESQTRNSSQRHSSIARFQVALWADEHAHGQQPHGGNCLDRNVCQSDGLPYGDEVLLQGLLSNRKGLRKIMMASESFVSLRTLMGPAWTSIFPSGRCTSWLISPSSASTAVCMLSSRSRLTPWPPCRTIVEPHRPYYMRCHRSCRSEEDLKEVSLLLRP